MIVTENDPSGRELGRTTTDDKGKFAFTAREHVNHCLVVKTPDGHSSDPHVIKASLLPDSLPAGVASDGNGPHVAAQATDNAGLPAVSAGKESEPAVARDQLAELSSQFKLLRDEVRESNEQLRVRDVLGGIGFILGLAGVAFYMKARGRRA